MAVRWTVEDLDKAVKCLKASTSLEQAVAAIRATVRHIEYPSDLRRLFKRNGREPPETYLLPTTRVPDEPPDTVRSQDFATAPTDPVQRRAAQDKARQLKREHANMVERVREAEARQKFLERTHNAPPVVFRREMGSGLREGTAVALASDWHVEETVDSEQVAGRNSFNMQIADVRIERFFRGLTWLIDFHREPFQLRDLVLWLGGDFITGWIHEEYLPENEASPIEATLWTQARLVSGIQWLLEHTDLERITVPCSYGNHGRTTRKTYNAAGARTSYEWLMYHQIAAAFADEPRVHFEINQSAHQYALVYDFPIHFHHGHDVRYAGGVGGITIPLNKRIAQWDQIRKCAYHYIGHYHQLHDHPRGTVNGSLIGYNAYAMSIGAGYEPPQQAFQIIDSKRGRTCASPIWVGEDS